VTGFGAVALAVELGPVTVDRWTDLFRLLAVPAFVWAAWHDHRTRRVPRHVVWPPLVAIALVALGWDLWAAWSAPFAYDWNRLTVRAGLSIGLVIPAAVLAYRLGGFGRADLKAVATLALLFPTAPIVIVDGGPALPLVRSEVGLFSLTILTNGVLINLLYPGWLGLRNLALGNGSRFAFFGRQVPTEELLGNHGRLLEGTVGPLPRGLDLDALRMYLRWRGITLSAVRCRPGLRHPSTLPAETNEPTDGALDAGVRKPDREAAPTVDSGAADFDPEALAEDPWGARRFVDDVGTVYGTTPEVLREGLDLIARQDRVWFSPGMPFLLPLTIGLIVALTYGDILFGVLGAIGLV
jgi:preflagellin peptidase FlaK